jgi:exodeoxyribonuclease VII large subunit
VLASPARDIDRRAIEIADLAARSRRCLGSALDRAVDDVVHLIARVRALSPAATLERGYAIVQDPSGTVLRSAADAEIGTEVGIRLAAGRLTATVGSRDPAS